MKQKGNIDSYSFDLVIITLSTYTSNLWIAMKF